MHQIAYLNSKMFRDHKPGLPLLGDDNNKIHEPIQPTGTKMAIEITAEVQLTNL